MACYEQFHWGPAQIDECLERGMEADRLSIYFEEIGAYQYKRNRELSSNTGSGVGRSEQTVIELYMADEDMDDYSAFLEDIDA